MRPACSQRLGRWPEHRPFDGLSTMATSPSVFSACPGQPTLTVYHLAMTRAYGPCLDLGFSFVHTHTRPFTELSLLAQVSEGICVPGQVRDPHSHEVFELFYVLTGKGKRVVDGI